MGQERWGVCLVGAGKGEGRVCLVGAGKVVGLFSWGREGGGGLFSWGRKGGGSV